MLYVLICGHESHAPDLAFVLACGSLMQFRIRILSSALLASAFEMSTLRPWPRHTLAHSASLGYSMTRLLSSLMSDSEGQNPCYPFANRLRNRKKSHEGSVKITLLRVIPTMTFIQFLTGKSSGILSDISSGILPGISSGILSGKSSGVLSGISSGILSA